MTNAITIPAGFGPVSSVFAGRPVENDLSAGVQTGFAIVGYRGKVWSLRYRGDERQLMRDDGDGPRNSIEVVILKAASVVSKVWYKDGFTEGSNAAPDCFSTNGLTPDAQSRNKQCNTCAACPMNAWGSRVTPAGKAGKACSDSKRAAVVPLGDIRNEVYGGPMLLRVPAASLNELAQFGNKLASLGYPYYGVGVRISFDAAEAYPKFQFGAIRPLSDEEARAVIEMQNSGAVSRILAEGSEHAAPEQAPVSREAALQAVFEQPPAPAPAPAPVAAAPVAAAPVAAAPKRDYKKRPATPTPAPAPEPVITENAATGSSFDDELDSQLDALLGD